MFAQKRAYFLNSGKNCHSEFPFSEMDSHDLNHFLPKIVSAFLLNRDVTDNGM